MQGSWRLRARASHVLSGCGIGGQGQPGSCKPHKPVASDLHDSKDTEPRSSANPTRSGPTSPGPHLTSNSRRLAYICTLRTPKPFNMLHLLQAFASFCPAKNSEPGGNAVSAGCLLGNLEKLRGAVDFRDCEPSVVGKVLRILGSIEPPEPPNLPYSDSAYGGQP